MYTILKRALPLFCVILFAVSVRGDHCAPRFHGKVFAVRLTSAAVDDQVVYFVFDQDVFSEYVYSPDTGETRQMGTAKMSRNRLADATEEVAIHIAASAATDAHDVVFRIQDGELTGGSNFEVPEVLDPEERIATFEELNRPTQRNRLTPHATKFVVKPTASISCCASCWGVHAALTAQGCSGIGICLDFNMLLDPICCLGGC